MALPFSLAPFDLTDVLTISPDATKLGLYNELPQATFDINGSLHVSQGATTATISASNVTACNVTAAHVTAPIVTASNVLASNLAAYTDVICPHVSCAGILSMMDTDLSEPCPIDHPFYETFTASHAGPGGLIDKSWIHIDPDVWTMVDDIMGLVKTGVEIAQILKALNDLLNPVDGLGLLETALQNALENLGDPFSSNIKFRVGWENLVRKPWAARGTGANQDIGLSNVCFSGGLYHIAPTSLTTDTDGNTIFFAGSPSIFKVIDENQNAWLNNVGASNVGHKSGCNYLAFRDTAVTIVNSNSSLAVNLSNVTVAYSNVTSGGVAWGSNTAVIDTRLGDITALGKVDCGNLVTEQWISPSTGGYIKFDPNVSLQSKYQLRGADPNDTKVSYLTQTDSTLSWKTQTSQNNWGISNGIPAQVSQFSADSNGSLFVRSNLTMGSPLLLRSLFPPSLDGYPQEGQMTLAANNLRYITRTSPSAGSNVDVTNFSVNSNGTFLLSTKFPKILGNLENLAVPNPNGPAPLFSNVTLSNFARLEASFSNGMTYGAGLNNNLFSTDRSLDVFNVSPLGQISTFDSNGLREIHVNSNGEFQKSNLTIRKDGSVTTPLGTLVTSTGILRAPGIYGNDFLVTSVIDPYTQLYTATSNFVRMDLNPADGLVMSRGIEGQDGSSPFMKVSRRGELRTTDTASNTFLHITSNAEFIKGDLLIANDGSIKKAGAPLLDANGAIRRQTEFGSTTNGLVISPSGYLTVGALMITDTGDVYMNNRLIIDKYGNLRNVNIDNSVTLRDISWMQAASVQYESLAFT